MFRLYFVVVALSHVSFLVPITVLTQIMKRNIRILYMDLGRLSMTRTPKVITSHAEFQSFMIYHPLRSFFSSFNEGGQQAYSYYNELFFSAFWTPPFFKKCIQIGQSYIFMSCYEGTPTWRERVNFFFFTWNCVSLSGCDPRVSSWKKKQVFFSFNISPFFFNREKSCIFTACLHALFIHFIFYFCSKRTFRIKVGVNDICLKSWQPSKIHFCPSADVS